MTRMLFIAAIYCMSGIAASAASADADANESKAALRIVFFTPADVEPPEGAAEQVATVVDYGEQFYVKWMKHWGYSCDKPMRVPREKNGAPVIIWYKGKQKADSGAYKQLGYARSEIIPTLSKQLKLPRTGQFWWVFSYPGPARRAYRGGGDFRGGASSANFRDTTGSLSLELEMAEGLNDPFALKACIHELGHAFGLPHIGPIEGDKLGNSLMGPINKVYKGLYDGDPRVYLSKASAAMMWKHPLFEGDGKELDVTPGVEIQDFKAIHDPDKKTIVVTGRLVSDQSAHSVVIANASQADKSGYWRKTFANRLDKDDAFRVVIKEVKPSGGSLNISFCFDNGAVKGPGDRFGLSSGQAFAYSLKDGRIVFD